MLSFFKMTKYKKIPTEVSIHIRYLHQDKGESLKDLIVRYPEYSQTSLHRHSKKPIGQTFKDLRNENKGRPRLLTDRDNRKIVQSVKELRDTLGNFTSTDLQKSSGIKESKVSNRTVRRSLKRLGYNYDQCRKKGQLLEDDLKKRLKFARKCKAQPTNFWTEGISFYLDGTGWVHKTKPMESSRTDRSRTWKKKGERLKRQCLSKGKKEGVGGRMIKFMVAIAHNKGVIKCHQFTGPINSETCKSFIDDHFSDMFANSAKPKGKLFLQDGDPSQNSKIACDAMDSVGCKLFKIPPRSPDLNPIENIIHLIGKQLKKDAITKNIEHQTYQQFSERARKTVLSFHMRLSTKPLNQCPKELIKSSRLKDKEPNISIYYFIT